MISDKIEKNQKLMEKYNLFPYLEMKNLDRIVEEKFVNSDKNYIEIILV
jgi:hypothetical protein